MNIIFKIGKIFFDIFSSVGEIVLFFFDCFKYLILDRFYPKIFLQHLIKIGYNSLPVVGLTSIFTGMVLGALIGNAITDTNKGGQAGAVFGGLMAADKKKSQKVISGYQTQRQCQTVYDNVSSQHITGYKIWFTHNGMTGTATTTTKYRVGQKIQVKMGISID